MKKDRPLIEKPRRFAEANFSSESNKIEYFVNDRVGRRASYTGRSRIERGGGLYTSENAGMSSENYVRIIMAERLRF